MATDYGKIVEDLLAFYDFRDKTIVAVGAGGGQLIEYGRPARKVIAVDNDAPALDKLRENLKAAGLEDKFTRVLCDFNRAATTGDAVLFEFCLHELPDPAAALRHAKDLAPDVVIFDHGPGSDWAFFASEEDKVRISWRAVEGFPIRKRQSFRAIHAFKTYEELFLKVKSQGETSLRRIEKFRNDTDIAIPLIYEMALI